MKKTILSLIMPAALCLALGCGVAMADESGTVSVTYLDQNNNEQTVTATVVDTAYVTDEDNSGRTHCNFWGEFYYVNSDVNITEVGMATGVNLILGPNADLDLTVNETSQGTLNIFAAKDGSGSCSIDNHGSTVITLYGGTYTNTAADNWQLGSGFCFRKNSSDSQTYSTGAQVVYCGHVSWESGKCARCGFACTHKDSGGSGTLNFDTGKCSVCGKQLHTVSVENTSSSYETFNKAYDAFKQIAGTIRVKLLANAGFSGNYTQIDRKDVTLDLNGFTFKRAGDSASNTTYIDNGSNVTIQDGSEAKTGQALNLVLSGTTNYPSSLTMKDGVYVNDIQVQQYSTLIVENASIGMNEATAPNTSDRLQVMKLSSKLVMNASAVKHLSVGTNVTDVTLNGGSFGEIYRRNGDFGGLLGEGRAYQYTSGANQGKLVDLTALTGTETLENVAVVAHTEHTYSSSGSGTCLYCPQEHAHNSSSSINPKTGRCTACGKALYGAKYGSTLTETLKEAIEQAQAGDTVTVLDDTALPNGFTIGKTLTLELNGKKLTGDLNAQARRLSP